MWQKYWALYRELASNWESVAVTLLSMFGETTGTMRAIFSNLRQRFCTLQEAFLKIR
jgi:hypothetical protein